MAVTLTICVDRPSFVRQLSLGPPNPGFRSRWQGSLQCNQSKYLLQLGKEFASSETLNFEATEILSDWPTIVFRGILQPSSQGQNGNQLQRQVVVKFKRRVDTPLNETKPDKPLDKTNVKTPLRKTGRIEREAELYCSMLQPAWGHLVPQFYGFFQSEIGECLLLEDCGETLPEETELSSEQDLLVEFAAVLMAIHQIGIEFQDLQHTFIYGYRQNGRLSMCGFGAGRLHKCGSQAPLYFGRLRPDKDKFGCRSLLAWLELAQFYAFDYIVLHLPWSTLAIKCTKLPTVKAVKIQAKELIRKSTDAQKLEDPSARTVLRKEISNQIQLWMDQYGHLVDYVEGKANREVRPKSWGPISGPSKPHYVPEPSSQ